MMEWYSARRSMWSSPAASASTASAACCAERPVLSGRAQPRSGSGAMAISIGDINYKEREREREPCDACDLSDLSRALSISPIEATQGIPSAHIVGIAGQMHPDFLEAATRHDS